MNTQHTKRKLTAILSADVVGYSRLMGEDDAATVRTLGEYREVIANTIIQYRGRVVDSPGDNLLAEFASVVDTVQCATEIQRELAERNTDIPAARKMEYRIGVNLGDVIQEGDRIYGDGVNVAARLESLAEPGGICISGIAHDQVKNKLDLEYQFVGKKSVKNIKEPIRVYRVLSFPGAAAHRVRRARDAVKRTWLRAALGIAAVVVVGIALAVWHFYFRPLLIEPASLEKMAYPLPDKPSIAVLPFENMSDDPEQEFFCDGMSDQIITALSKSHRLFVIARNSTFVYKGKPVKVQTVAEDLGVRYVLEGSIQKAGDRIRITAQLIDALSGNHLWAERYDREFKDIFAIQDEITLRILSSLHVKLTGGEQARLLAKGTDNFEAYLKVMQGIEHVHQFSSPEENALGRKLFEEAIELDPNYADAYMLLAYTYKWEAGYGASKKPLKKSIELAEKALSINGYMPWAHICLAEIYSLMADFDKALAEGEKAIALEPNGAGANAGFGVILSLTLHKRQA